MAVAIGEVEDEFKNDCIFVTKEVEAIVKGILDEILGDRKYDDRLVTEDTNQILAGVIRGLIRREKPFKYIVNCVIGPKIGGALKASTLCYWEDEKDGLVSVHWENEHILAIVYVWGVAYFQSTVPIIDNIVGKFRREGDRLIPLSKSKHTGNKPQ